MLAFLLIMNEFIKAAEKRLKKSSEITEIDIEKPFVDYAKTLGCRAYKLVFLVGRGFPDRTVLCPGGRVLFIEFKRKERSLSPTQIPVKKILESLGFEYYVCDELGQAEKILKNFLKKV